MSKINQYSEKGQPCGLWEYYYSNDQLNYKVTYVNGQYHGLLEYYYPNGQLSCKGTYINGKEHDLWEHYHRDGTIEKQIFYSKHLYDQN